MVNEAHKKSSNMLATSQNLMPIQTTLISGRHQARKALRDSLRKTQVHEPNGSAMTETSHLSEVSGMHATAAAQMDGSHTNNFHSKKSTASSGRHGQTNMIII
jgi:hypothetical protein